MCHRKNSKIKIPNALIAEAANTSESLVKKVRNGKRNAETVKGEKIKLAEMLLEEGQNKLLQDVKRLLQNDFL